jgi:hypothetical protein
MGRQIVYCEGCGHNLREDDFEKGRARMIDNRPFCTECRPYRPGEGDPPPPRKSSSGKVPAAAPPRKTSTGSIPIVQPPRRPATSVTGTNPLPIIAGVGAVVFVILIFAVTQSGSRRVPVTETAPIPAPEPLVVRRADPTPPPAPPPPPPPSPVVPVPRGTPPPPAAPSGPLVAPTASEKLDAFIAQIRSMIQGDERQERTDEILNMFSAAAKGAGPRSAEVAKMKAEYLATLPENVRKAVVWSDWRITSNGEGGMTVLLPSYNGRDNVYQTHPLDRSTPAKLEREVEVPAGKKTTFSFWVCCHQKGDFELRVFVNDKPVIKEIIGPPGSSWREKAVDLSPYAGKKVALRVENFPNDWSWEHGFWSDFTITSE